MSHPTRAGAARARPRRVLLPFAAGAGVLALSGCSTAAWKRGLLPQGATDNSHITQSLWNGAWIAALCVGVVVWGLIAWCLLRYRRPKGDAGLPEQLRYNVPIEVLYTTVPVMMVSVLFYFTARDETRLLNTSQRPAVVVNVIGKQWAWDFNYVKENVYEAGVQANTLDGKPGAEAVLPTLYLPVNERVEFVLTTRDVNHQFWVPAFLQKLQLQAGRVNRFQVTPDRVGTYRGKCAMLCGAYHAEMLFNVKIVPRQQYDAQIARLRASGNSGQLPNTLSRNPVPALDAPGVTGGNR